MQDELYKEDESFIGLLKSSNRKLKYEYRNAIIKELNYRKETGFECHVENIKLIGKEATQFYWMNIFHIALLILASLYAIDIIIFLILKYIVHQSLFGLWLRVLVLILSILCLQLMRIIQNRIIDDISATRMNSITYALDVCDGCVYDITDTLINDDYLMLLSKKNAIDEALNL